MQRIPLAFLAFFCAGAAQAQDFLAVPPQPGVYECYGQNAMAAIPMVFGLIDGSTYRNAEGRDGQYSYDPATGVLSLDAGTGAAARYMRIGENSFRVLLESGELGGFVCPLNTAKDPSSPPW